MLSISEQGRRIQEEKTSVGEEGEGRQTIDVLPESIQFEENQEKNRRWEEAFTDRMVVKIQDTGVFQRSYGDDQHLQHVNIVG